MINIIQVNKEQAWKAYTILHSEGPIYSDEMDDNAKADFMSGYDAAQSEAIANLATWFDNRRIFRSEDESLKMARRIINGETDAVSE